MRLIDRDEITAADINFMLEYAKENDKDQAAQICKLLDAEKTVQLPISSDDFDILLFDIRKILKDAMYEIKKELVVNPPVNPALICRLQGDILETGRIIGEVIQKTETKINRLKSCMFGFEFKNAQVDKESKE